MSAVMSKKKRDRPPASQAPAHHSGESRNPVTNSSQSRAGAKVQDGWRWVTLGDVVESMKNGIYKPSSFYAEDGLACLRMYNIEGGQIVWRDIKRMHLSETEILDYELLPGDLLINRVNSRELVGKAAVVPSGLERCVFESKNIRVRVKRDLAIPEFINYRLLSAGSSYFNQNAQQVVGMASISQLQVARFPVPLPSLAEQRQIVAEIEKQFTRLDAGVDALRRVQANLKRYRAAVLKAACEGHLVPTEAELAKAEGRTYETGEQLLARILADRRKHWHGRGKYKEPTASETTDLPSLPEGWIWATVEQLAEVVRGASPRPAGDPRYFGGSVPWITVGPLTADQSPYLRAVPATLNEAGREHSRFIEPHTLLLTNSGATLGVPKISLIGGCINDGVAALQDVDYPLKLYLLYFLHTQTERLRGVNQGAAQPNLNTTIIKAINVPLPPLAEQVRTVAEVERRLSVIEELDGAVAANLQRAPRLRQSILQRAFNAKQ